MAEPLISEWTSGQVGETWYKKTFFASVSEAGFSVKDIASVGRQDIEKVVSVPLDTMAGQIVALPYVEQIGALRIVHRSAHASPNIAFLSTKSRAWLEAFDALGIAIEDPLKLRHPANPLERVGCVGASIMVLIAVVSIFVLR